MKITGLQNCSVFLDTNILIYAFTTTRFTPACEDLLDNVRDGVVNCHVNSTVIDEFFHKILLMQVYAEKGLQPAEAIDFLKQNLLTPRPTRKNLRQSCLPHTHKSFGKHIALTFSVGRSPNKINPPGVSPADRISSIILSVRDLSDFFCISHPFFIENDCFCPDLYFHLKTKKIQNELKNKLDLI